MGRDYAISTDVIGTHKLRSSPHRCIITMYNDDVYSLTLTGQQLRNVTPCSDTASLLI